MPFRACHHHRGVQRKSFKQVQVKVARPIGDHDARSSGDPLFGTLLNCRSTARPAQDKARHCQANTAATSDCVHRLRGKPRSEDQNLSARCAFRHRGNWCDWPRGQELRQHLRPTWHFADEQRASLRANRRKCVRRRDWPAPKGRRPARPIVQSAQSTGDHDRCTMSVLALRCLAAPGNVGAEQSAARRQQRTATEIRKRSENQITGYCRDSRNTRKISRIMGNLVMQMGVAGIALHQRPERAMPCFPDQRRKPAHVGIATQFPSQAR